MKVSVFKHTLQSGWSTPELPSMDSPNTLIIVFGAPEYRDHPDALIELNSTFPQSIKIGCSTAGEIFGETIQDRSLSVSVLQFEYSEIRLASSSITRESSYKAGQSIASTLERDDLKSIFILSDGLNVNGSELVNGMDESLSRPHLISGGLAGDGDRFNNTWTWRGGEVKTGEVIAVGFYGDSLEFMHGSYGGWSAFGPERLVTRSKENVLFKLDNHPALELYKQYLGEEAKHLPASGLLFPLAIRSERGIGEQIVRTILAIDEEQKSITFAGTIPEGSYAQLMSANFEQLIEGASQAVNQMPTPSNISYQGILLGVSCVGRRLLLGERAEEELESVLESLPDSTNFSGFYSYGEISPNVSGVNCSLKNQTMTLTYINENPCIPS